MYSIPKTTIYNYIQVDRNQFFAYRDQVHPVQHKHISYRRTLFPGLTFLMIMEYCENGCLLDYLRQFKVNNPLPEATSMVIASDLGKSTGLPVINTVRLVDRKSAMPLDDVSISKLANQAKGYTVRKSFKLFGV